MPVCAPDARHRSKKSPRPHSRSGEASPWPQRRRRRRFLQGLALPRDAGAPENEEDIVLETTLDTVAAPLADRTCSPDEQAAAISALRNGASVNAVAALLGKSPGSAEWLLKKLG
jgi:hypothetical protein